jgi:hypothetical protein
LRLVQHAQVEAGTWGARVEGALLGEQREHVGQLRLGRGADLGSERVGSANGSTPRSAAGECRPKPRFTNASCVALHVEHADRVREKPPSPSARPGTHTARGTPRGACSPAASAWPWSGVPIEYGGLK